MRLRARLATGRAALPVAWLAALLALAGVACAGDRPFLALTSAAAEEDDERTWSIQSLAWRDRGQKTFALAAEYAFDPVRSLQLELGRSRAEGVRTSSAELEGKWLFNHIARDDWGIGLVVAAGARREGDAGWRGGDWSVTVPVSWQPAPGTLLHLNLGRARERGAEGETLLAFGGETELTRRLRLHVEAAREGEQRLVHAGLRWWLKRERVALDFGAVQRRVGGERFNGGLLALSFYDL